MNQRASIPMVLACSALLGAAGCAGDGSSMMPVPQSGNDDLVAVLDGKADNFFSTTAQEYYVTGASTVTLEPELKDATAAKKLARAKELVSLKNVVLTWFLTVRLVDKTGGTGEHADPNANTYPGFHGMARDGAYENLNIRPSDAEPKGLVYSFDFKLQAAGARDLISRLPGDPVAGDPTAKKFQLAVGKIANDDMANLDAEHEWFRDDQWESGKFDPTKLPHDSLEWVDMTIKPQPASKDGYIDLKRLYADGKVTMAVHFGWDYWDRYDVKNAEAYFDYLVGLGFKSPVEKFADLDRKSGPLTRTFNANGKPIVAEVSLFHPGQPGVASGSDPDTDEGGLELEQDMYESFKTKEIVVFEGHSGDFYGFALANWRKTSKGAIDYPQIRSMEMPADTYQIVLANGCDTYSIGQAFWENPAKANKKNLDVITTTTFSDASSIQTLRDLTEAVTAPSDGKNVPRTYNELMTEFNGRWGIGAMYGVHGIDNNPRRHPYANVYKQRSRCSADADCGSEGNRCVAGTSGTKTCAMICLDDTGCTSGYRCTDVASRASSTLVGKVCLR